MKCYILKCLLGRVMFSTYSGTISPRKLDIKRSNIAYNANSQLQDSWLNILVLPKWLLVRKLRNDMYIYTHSQTVKFLDMILHLTHDQLVKIKTSEDDCDAQLI